MVNEIKKGDIVLYRPIVDEPDGKLLLVRTGAWTTGNNSYEVVNLRGRLGYVLADHCTVINTGLISRLLLEKAGKQHGLHALF